ncbi:uncharacterized protein si:dkey-10c21.1 [Astyanax mexicanus]|uniref:uncharacterized protein si:dkey-10c21.1 n=1 Tax=Astyanax mexicanus TaxID=7994 RepID=UPI0020CB5C72|nr:uncharacterized protein si:dkey-10c21.1 [Astyanax mexicanus]
MDFKAIVKRNKPDLIKWLHGNDIVLQYVDSQEIISSTEYKNLKIIDNYDKKNTMLLDMIWDKGQDSCRNFLNVLKKGGVNESSPDLQRWISTVDTSDTSATSVQTPVAGVSTSANSSTSPAGNQTIADKKEFLKTKRSKLINKVKNVDAIADDLNLTNEMRSIVEAQLTDHAKMRKVLEFTNSTKATELLIDALWKHAGDIMEDLTSEA